MKLKHPNRTPVIVHQMGKVASTSVSSSLAEAGDRDVFHTHRLNPRTLNIRLRYHERTNTAVPRVDRAAQFIIENFLSRGRKVQLVSLVREPIARNISAYFETLDTRWGIKDAHVSIPIEQLLERFIDEYDHDIPDKWFDDEIRETVALDVFEKPFPQQQGYVLLGNERADLLVMKHDLDDGLKGVALGKLLGTEPLKVKRANVGRRKKYGNTYETFRRSIRLREAFVRRMLDSRYARHFYTPKEREIAFQKWTSTDTKVRAEAANPS